MIIGITGLKGSGKSTAASMLSEKKGYEIRSFAKPVKSLCLATFSFLTEEMVNDPELKDKSILDNCKGLQLDNCKDISLKESDAKALLDELEKILSGVFVDVINKAIINKINGFHFSTPRQLLQFIGTDVCRNLISDTIWIDIATQGLHSTDKVVFDDCRFKNEAEAIRKLGGVIVELERGQFEVKDDAIDTHISESQVSELKCDALIPNLGDVQALSNRILFVEHHFAPTEGLA